MNVVTNDLEFLTSTVDALVNADVVFLAEGSLDRKTHFVEIDVRDVDPSR
jgi:hypothetical protein